MSDGGMESVPRAVRSADILSASGRSPLQLSPEGILFRNGFAPRAQADRMSALLTAPGTDLAYCIALMSFSSTRS
jgi:hypothetical protein